MNRHAIDVIENAVTIPAVLGLHGIRYQGHRCRCPIHNGNRDSFSFNDTLFHCFNCGAGGGVIQLEAKLDNSTEDEACEKLAKYFGLDITEKPFTKQDKINWYIQKRIDEDYEENKEEDNNYYLQLANLYRNIWSVPELSEITESLDEWLEDNIDGVVQPWRYLNTV